MRTLLLLLVMALLALVSGLSFVVRAAAQTPGSATLSADCGGPGVVPSGEATLITCTATTHNTGSTTLEGAQLQLLPAANVQPPEVYVFWSETHDGVHSVPGESQLNYDIGDLGPDASSTIRLEVIVRSTHEFGADVALVAQPDQHEYARMTVRGAVGGAAAPGIPVTFVRQDDQAPWVPPTYHLSITNAGATPYDNVKVELSPGADVVVKSSEWKRDATTGRSAADFGALAAGTSIERDLIFAQLGTGCTGVRPVLVVTVVESGAMRRQPFVADYAPLGVCGEYPGRGVALPDSGGGPAAGGGRERPSAAALGIGGTLCLVMGASMRNWRRRRRPR